MISTEARSNSDPPPVEPVDYPAPGSASSACTRRSATTNAGSACTSRNCLAARDWQAAQSDAESRRAAPEVAGDVTEERHYWPGHDDPTALLLRQGGGFARTISTGHGARRARRRLRRRAQPSARSPRHWHSCSTWTRPPSRRTRRRRSTTARRRHAAPARRRVGAPARLRGRNSANTADVSGATASFHRADIPVHPGATNGRGRRSANARPRPVVSTERLLTPRKRSMADSPSPPRPTRCWASPPTRLTRRLRAAYRRTLRVTHPDTGGDPARFDAVQRAWVLVGTPRPGAAFDRGTCGNGSAPARRPGRRPRRAGRATPVRSPGRTATPAG